MLTGSASAGPIVVAIEDLHWADPQSLDFIATLSGLLTGAAALMLVITSRTPVPACLRSDTRWESIGLTALSADELQLMLVRSPLAPGLPEATRRLIARHAEGIPLYAHELASLTAKGPDRLVSDSHYRLLASPNRLNAALLARLDAVGELKPLAQAAAVLGRTFETRVLAALLEAEPTTLRRRLEALVARGILRPAYQPPGAHYRFSHTLLWTTAYGSILKSRRRQLHARAAVELSTGFPELAETAPERAAHHFTKAGDHATAFAWWRTAALRAEAHGTPATVIGHVNRALAARIAAPEAGTSLDEAQLLSLLGKQLGVLNGRASTDTETAYRRALVLLSQLPSRPADLRFDIQWGLSAFHLVRGETDAAMEASSHLIEAARAAGRNDQLLVALRIHGTAKLLYGCVQDAIDLLRMAAALYDPAIHGLLGYRYVSDQGIVALCHLAWATAIAGDVEASVAAQRKALVLAGERAHAHTSANALGVLSTAASIRGDTGSAAALARACKHLSEAHRFEYWAVRSAFILSWIEGQRDPARGLAMIQDAAVRYRKTGSARAMALLDCLEAEIALHAGKPDLALAALARSDAVGAVRPRFIYASEILRLRALALAATHPLHRSQAVALLEQAERTAVEQGAHTFAGRAAEARARLGNRRVPSLVRLPPMTSMSKLSKE